MTVDSRVRSLLHQVARMPLLPMAADRQGLKRRTRDRGSADALPPGNAECRLTGSMLKPSRDFLTSWRSTQSTASPALRSTGLAKPTMPSGDYRGAAQNFLKGYQDYPKSRRAPDSLLKLGLSLEEDGREGTRLRIACSGQQRIPQCGRGQEAGADRIPPFRLLAPDLMAGETRSISPPRNCFPHRNLPFQAGLIRSR